MFRSDMLSVKDVAAMLGVSQSAIYKWAASGAFPKPYKLGDGDARRSASRWSRAEIIEWLEARRGD